MSSEPTRETLICEVHALHVLLHEARAECQMWRIRAEARAVLIDALKAKLDELRGQPPEFPARALRGGSGVFLG
jgi:hypothetical protein